LLGRSVVLKRLWPGAQPPAVGVRPAQASGGQFLARDALNMTSEPHAPRLNEILPDSRCDVNVQLGFTWSVETGAYEWQLLANIVSCAAVFGLGCKA